MLITSLLDPRHKAALEDLLFSHPDQGRFRRNIIDSVERHGLPRVVERQGGLRVELSLLKDVQSLYAVDDDKLAGVLIYSRTTIDHLEILHIVVKKDYTYRGKQSQLGVTSLLVDAVCSAAHQVRGIKAVRLAYKQGKVILSPIHSSAGPG